MFATAAAMGNPPQLFRLAIVLAWAPSLFHHHDAAVGLQSVRVIRSNMRLISH